VSNQGKKNVIGPPKASRFGVMFGKQKGVYGVRSGTVERAPSELLGPPAW